MKTYEIVRICDIIQDMRQNYSVGITVAREWKVKLILKKIIEGDADKQYANLWRYVVELQRVNAENTMKINVDRPNPSIQLREKYALCYGFAMSPINGQEMWPEVQNEELLPPLYKKGPGRPRKLIIKECGEDGDRRRLHGVSYRCIKCDKFGYNIQLHKSKKQDPNALKRKKKVKDDTSNVNQSGNKTGTKTETETDINTTHPAIQTKTDINTKNLTMQT
ncbi:hypothetical protein KIW84_042001 [Lathyrus oleraceus]|uniref:Uncharacterized protein n=1 Tax=Pisum sativum TaxID=3888 RepID=A0A9D4XBN6_PEA|nr:hypothetical protein KIW84_042001 [Pisum sativum]